MVEQVASPKVLVIGLNPYRVPGPWDPKPVAEAIAAGMRKFTEHGLSAQSCLVGLDGLNDLNDQDDSEGMVIAALQSHAWDCVVVGGGIRTAEDQRELFERVINQIRCHTLQAAIAFNATPADTYDAAAR